LFGGELDLFQRTVLSAAFGGTSFASSGIGSGIFHEEIINE
jgi:hypothetical protein